MASICHLKILNWKTANTTKNPPTRIHVAQLIYSNPHCPAIYTSYFQLDTLRQRSISKKVSLSQSCSLEVPHSVAMS